VFQGGSLGGARFGCSETVRGLFDFFRAVKLSARGNEGRFKGAGWIHRGDRPGGTKVHECRLAALAPTAADHRPITLPR